MQPAQAPQSHKRKEPNPPEPALPMAPAVHDTTRPQAPPRQPGPAIPGTQPPCSMQVWMQGRCIAVDGEEEVLFMQAFEQAAEYYDILVAPHIASAEATTPRTIDALKSLFRAACTEFSRGSQIAAAREAAAAATLDGGPCTTQLQALLDGGTDIDHFAKQVQARNAPDRFNAARLAPFESLVDPVDFGRLLDIATVGVHIPVPEGFRPAPPNNSQRRLTQQLGNTHLLHYLQSIAKGNCIAVDPAFCLPSQISDLAFMDHNWVARQARWRRSTGRQGSRLH